MPISASGSADTSIIQRLHYGAVDSTVRNLLA
jgi:hypothetical protein